MLKNNKGFNLIMMSAIIIVLGIIMTATMGFYNVNNANKRLLLNESKFKKIEEKIKNYVINYGRLPCPAPLNCDMNNCVANADKLGFEKKNVNNECVTDNNGVFESKNSNSERILYGGVPTMNLGLSNNFLIDAWGNKIVYIVPNDLTLPKSLKKILHYKNNNLYSENVKDGLLYLLISFNKNLNGAFSYDNKESNYFVGSENYPIQNFSVNYNNGNYLYRYEQLNLFDIGEIEEELQNCAAFKENIEVSEFNYLESAFGEVVFAGELCPRNVSYPAKNTDYYYLSTYIDENGYVIDNKPAKKCEKNGKWSSGYVYECKKAIKCSRPSSVYPVKDWSSFNFEVVNTGVVYDKDRSVKIKCIVNKDGANWYRVD